MRNFKKTDINNFLINTNIELEKLNQPLFAILGIGNDGHTASLFPGCNFSNQLKFYNIVDYKDPFLRITLSMNYLKRINNIFFLVSGRKKSNMINKLINNSKNDKIFPAKQLINGSIGEVTLLLDRESFSL